MSTWHMERQIDRLEEDLAKTDDPEERKALLDEIREIGRAMAEHERWLEDGRDRGWL